MPKSDNNMTAKRVKELRKKLDITQDEFATKIGVTVDTIRKIEQGNVVLTIKNAVAIRRSFDVSLDWLYGVADDLGDEASNILVALRKYFKIGHKFHSELNKAVLSVSMDENLLKFLTEIDEAEQICLEKELPVVAREAWINDIKARYNESLKAGGEATSVDYVLEPFSSIKVERKGTPTANPAHYIG